MSSPSCSINLDTRLMLEGQDVENSLSSKDRPNEIYRYCKILDSDNPNVSDIPKDMKFAFSAVFQDDDPSCKTGGLCCRELIDELKNISTSSLGACRGGPDYLWGSTKKISAVWMMVIVIITVAIVIAFVLIAYFGVLPPKSPVFGNFFNARSRR